MVEQIELLPEALQDVAEAYAWYEERRGGLGEEFLRCVEACLLIIRQDPQLHAVAHEDYRQALVRRFPYAIFYEHLEDRIIVYSVFHCSRDPEKWRKRLR